DASGRESSLSQKWFVHLHKAHLAGIQSIFTAHNWSGTVTIRSAIDGRVENNGTRKDPRMSKKHLEPDGSTAGDDMLHLKMITNESRISVAMAAQHTLTNSAGEKIDPKDKYIVEADYVAQDMSVKISEGQAIDLKKVVSICSSRDPATSEPGLAARRILEDAADFSALMAEQTDIWGNYWRHFDLFIETTEEHSKMLPSLVVHLNSFHAMQAASSNIVDFDCGIPARGLTGEGYQGHIFWDDLFMFSFINMRTPNITRALLKYRYRRLPEARKIAASMGARGACFPWQSGSTGREETPPLVWIPELNHWAPDHTHLEIHVNAAIAYNIWQYYQVTESLDFMHSYGAEILLEIARFFATFSKYNKKSDRFEIDGVIGPDEYHNGYPNAEEPGINNNAYTNVMAAWTLSTAVQLLKVLPQDYREQLSHRLKITSEEIELWEQISKRMYVPFMNDGIIAQFDGYEKLEEFPWHVDNHPDMKQMGVALQKNGLVLNPYKLSKQPDVLMLFYVFSSDELGELFKQLGYRWSEKMIDQNIEYYMPRTANTSTLSRVALAWVLSRMNRKGSWDLVEKIAPVRKDPNAAAPVSQQPQSWKIFLEALGSDLFDIEGGSTTREGIHMAAMSGTLDIVQRCYGGIVTRDDVLWLDPQLPAALTRLSFNLHYRGQALELDITHESIRIVVSHSSAQKIKIGFMDRVYALDSGDTKVFKLGSTRAHKKVAKPRKTARTKARSTVSRDRNGNSNGNGKGDRKRSSAKKRTRAATKK
ncbi:MAG TPA: glycosyl hydrolase family 65 protein, partial [Trichormus sp.]